MGSSSTERTASSPTSASTAARLNYVQYDILLRNHLFSECKLKLRPGRGLALLRDVLPGLPRPATKVVCETTRAAHPRLYPSSSAPALRRQGSPGLALWAVLAELTHGLPAGLAAKVQQIILREFCKLYLCQVLGVLGEIVGYQYHAAWSIQVPVLGR